MLQDEIRRANFCRSVREAFARQADRGKQRSVVEGFAGPDFSRQQVQETILVPAVPEPLIVWILSGAAVVEEREFGGPWQANLVTSGDFFLTTSPTPYELRWKAKGPQPFEVMHLYLGLPIFNRAIKDVFNQDAGTPRLREVSGKKDNVLSMLLEQLRSELTARHRPSALFVQSIAQSLAVHLVRTYTDPNAKGREQRGGLPAFKLRRVTGLLETHLDEEFSLGRLAREAGVSEFHFCRLFKKTTGFAPSRYFIRMRMEKARRLLRETRKTIIARNTLVTLVSIPAAFAPPGADARRSL